MKPLKIVLVLLMTGILAANAQQPTAKYGTLWLPEGVRVFQAGDTLVAARGDSTGLRVRLYPVAVKQDQRSGMLRQKALEQGIPPYVRTVSDDQRKLSGIDWGGFVLGTLPRQTRETVEVYEEVGQVVNIQEDTSLVVEEDDSWVEAADSLAEGFSQPEGAPARQVVLVLYTKGNKSFLLELSIDLPEGNPMMLADIQRRWKP